MSSNVKFDPSIIDSILMDVGSKNNEINKNENKDKKIKQDKNNISKNTTDSFIDQLISNNQNNFNEDNEQKNNKIEEDCNTEEQIIKKNENNNKQHTINNNDQIISNISSQVDKLSAQLSQDKTNLIGGRNGEAVNYNHVYEELNSLIVYAKETLETLAAIEPDIIDPKQIQATASLISSIRGLVSEFSMIHRMNIKHQYNIELENIKQQHRLNTIEYKQEVRNQNNDVVGNATIVNNSSIPWSNDLILEFMEFMKQKGQK